MAHRRVRVVHLYTAVSLLILSVSHAWAEVPPSAIAHLNAAFAALDSLARETRTKGLLPRWSVPSDRLVLERVWDAPALLGTPPYSAKDVPLLIEIGEKQSAIYKTYVFFSTDPAILPDTAKNSVLFQDEITRASVMITTSFGAATQAMGDFVEHLKPEEMTDVRRRGLKRFRLGMLELVSGFALSLRSPASHDDNRALLVGSLSDNAAALAKATPRVDRSAFIATVQTFVASLPPELQAKMTVFISAMSSPVCDDLCAIE